MPPPGNPKALQLIRFSLMAWVTAVAAAAILLRRERTEEVTTLAAIAVAASALAVFGVFAMRERAARAPAAEAAPYVIAAWALGEAAALVGWILHMVGAPLPWVLPGTAVFILAMVLVSPPAQQSP